ncbi:hypothetical protein B0H16DRAFT_548760 [Mycena metata]|uniref:Secreted protein n=1 Tax=Mycena metata TaxID=1033252 RepID=A0AAD7JE11_9AGAR|nr:hypothetical protein B0H16DRAFT_548760 [Mycena metata]
MYALVFTLFISFTVDLPLEPSLPPTPGALERGDDDGRETNEGECAHADTESSTFSAWVGAEELVGGGRKVCTCLGVFFSSLSPLLPASLNARRRPHLPPHSFPPNPRHCVFRCTGVFAHTSCNLVSPSNLPKCASRQLGLHVRIRQNVRQNARAVDGSATPVHRWACRQMRPWRALPNPSDWAPTDNPPPSIHPVIFFPLMLLYLSTDDSA